MKIIGKVVGSAEQARPLVIGKDTIYVHTDILPFEKRGKVIDGLFTYNEIQYDKDEYIAILAQQNEKLDKDLTNTQLALCEIYEAIGGSK